MTKSSLIYRPEKSPDVQDIRDKHLKASQFESEIFSPDIAAELDVAVQTLNPVLLHVENHQESADDQPNELYEDTVKPQEVVDDNFALEPAATRSYALEAFLSETSQAEADSDGCRLRSLRDFGTSTETTEPCTSVGELNQSYEEPLGACGFQLDDGLTLAGEYSREVDVQQSPLLDDMEDTLFSNPWI